MSLRSDEIVITAAIVGAEVTRAQTPYVPYSAEEIAEEAARCVSAGASVIHLHVRDLHGAPACDPALFAAAVAAIRARCDVVIQVSTGGAVGMTVDQRTTGLTTDAEMASLSCGSSNFGDAIFENAWPTIREIAGRIEQARALPELELFELGHLETARRLRVGGLIPAAAFLQIVLGVDGALPARERVLRFFVEEVRAEDPRAHIGVAAMGRHEFAMAAVAIELGAHVRVGLEDNVYLERGVLAKGSAELVEKAARMARAAGRSPVSPGVLRGVIQARRMLRTQR